MCFFIVDREVPDFTLDRLAAVQRAAVEESRRFTGEGRPVRYVRSTFIPREAHCMCLFEADDAATVEALNREARLPFTRVVEAIELAP
jgi:hypothetical protein